MTASAPRSAPKYRLDRVLVRFRAGTTATAMSNAHARAHATVVRSYRSVPRLQVVKLPPHTSVMAAIRAYRKDPAVLYAEPDFRVQIVATPNDPRFAAQQWDMNNTGQADSGGDMGLPGADIHAVAAWNITTGSSNVVVGVIDSGVDYTHPDLAANMHALESDCNNGIDDDGNGYVDDCYGINVAYGTNDPYDDFFHGTHVSGTIGARGNNGTGIAGVNWAVGLVACKFLDDYGSGYTSDAIVCLDYFKDLKDNHGLNLVATNNSWGGGGYSQALSDAIDAQRQSGILFIAAAGNAGMDNDPGGFYPADYFLPNVISVTATDHFDDLAWFSNHGKRTVHLGAPGIEIMSTWPGAAYYTASGTSMAAPHVTGVAALLKAHDNSLDWRAIKNLILTGGDTIAATADTISGKRLNAYGALTCSNSELLARLRPTGDVALATAGSTVLIAVEHINCANSAGDVTVTINPGGVTLTLKDDGAAPDQVAGDGIYSGGWVVPAAGIYTAAITGGETFDIEVLRPYFYQPVAMNYRTIGGTNLLFSDEDVAKITPGFPIQFGDGSFDSLWVTSDGTISFDAPFVSWNVTAMPTPYVRTMVAPMWTDFVESARPWMDPPSPTQNVFWEVTGSAPNRELVVEWRDVFLYCGGEDMNGCIGLPDQSARFQTVFFESKSDILFNYADTEFGNDSNWGDFGAYSTVGIQIEGSSANQFSSLTPALENGVALLWTTSGANVNDPTPTITQLSPDSESIASDFTLAVTGTDFNPSSIIRWNGADRATTYIDSTHLSASIATGDTPYYGGYNVNVYTFTGGNSNTATFNLVGPLISSLSPATAPAGSAFTLTVIGSNFVPESYVVWAGTARATTFVDSGHLTVAIASTDSNLIGNIGVAVVNPGGAVTPYVWFAFTGPHPTGLYPGWLNGGSTDSGFYVNGDGFVNGDVVRWNGTSLPTTFKAGTQLMGSVGPNDLATTGQITITIQNAQGYVSPPMTLTVSDYSATLSPSSMTVTGGQVATYTVALANQYAPFNPNIFLACAVPSGFGSCSVSPTTTIPGGSGTVTATVTVQTTVNTAAASGTTWETPVVAFVFMLPLAGALVRRRRLWQVLSLALVMVAAGAFVSCGGGSRAFVSSTAPPAGTSPRSGTVTITATSGTLQHTTTAGLTIR